MSVFVLLFLGFSDKQTVENVFAGTYDHKYPLYTLVSKSNVTLVQPLRLKNRLIFTWKLLSGNRRLYLFARK